MTTFTVAVSSWASAQGGDLGDAKRVKQLVEDTDKFERQQRAKLEAEIAEKRRETVKRLKRLMSQYKADGKRRVAREIRRALTKLEGKVEDAEDDFAEQQVSSKIFDYGQDYYFKNDKIRGKISFMKNGKVNMVFKVGNSTKNEVWKFEEKEDHVLIENGGMLGEIYISEVPKSNKRSIMIRLGGQLRHEVITAKYR